MILRYWMLHVGIFPYLDTPQNSNYRTIFVSDKHFIAKKQQKVGSSVDKVEESGNMAHVRIIQWKKRHVVVNRGISAHH